MYEITTNITTFYLKCKCTEYTRRYVTMAAQRQIDSVMLGDTPVETAAEREKAALKAARASLKAAEKAAERSATSADDSAEVLTVFVSYTPRDSEGEPFRLKMKVPRGKTVKALVKAFAKSVARSERGYGLTLDPAECFVNREDDSFVRCVSLVPPFFSL